ncbi:MAG TPA: hypothetical protein VFC78_01095 [Tepidisphaeraceae bacterium]|nr:hypothetical protein [Tepidisphaeraceae bacterium]
MKTYSSSEANTGRAATTDGERADARGQDADASPSQALREALNRLGEVKEYAAYFLAAKIDALKISARNIGVYVALGLLGACAGVAVVVVGVVLLLIGAAHGIGAALGGMYWLGDLIIGVVVLAVVGAGAVFAASKLTGSTRKKTVEKYESRKRDQRIRYGHDVRERAIREQNAN